MANQRFGSRNFSRLGQPQQIQVLPERKIITFRDFRRGYTPSEQRQMVEMNASPNSHDMVVRLDNRLESAPGTTSIETYNQLISFPQAEYEYEGMAPFTSLPSRLALHPTLNETVDLVLYSAPGIGFRNEKFTTWFNLGMADRNEFAHTTFGGTFIFTDGLKVWERQTTGRDPMLLPEAPVAREYVSFAGRVFGFSTLIDGSFEPLGAQWSAADSNYRNWTGLGSGFELLVNDVSVGDKIMAAIPMNLDFIAVMMRQSIWIGKFTGLVDRPVEFSVRVPGVGCASRRTAKLSRFGVFTLNDAGVYLFDGNTATHLSKDIDAELIPLDYSRLEDYHATYDPMRKRYILFTPTTCYIYEVEYQRWLKRSFSSLDSLVYPTQIDPTRWFELVGNWNNQSNFVWLDYAGTNIGELNLLMLGDQTYPGEYSDYGGEILRTLAKEDRASRSYFGVPFRPYWETKLVDEQDAQDLITIKKQLLEYEGYGPVRIYLPNADNRYEPVISVGLAPRDYPSLAILNAEKVSKGTGIGIEFLYPDDVPITLPPQPDLDESDFPEFA